MNANGLNTKPQETILCSIFMHKFFVNFCVNQFLVWERFILFCFFQSMYGGTMEWFWIYVNIYIYVQIHV
jgi:hypothetical protein